MLELDGICGEEDRRHREGDATVAKISGRGKLCRQAGAVLQCPRGALEQALAHGVSWHWQTVHALRAVKVSRGTGRL